MVIKRSGVVEPFSREKIVLGVRDNGVGIENADQEKLFDPFFTTKQDWQSPGLGLSLVYRIAEAHDGEMLVESAPGHGTFIALVWDGKQSR